MDLESVRDDILLAALPHVAFDGWGRRTMQQAARDAGHDASMAERAFPGGPAALVEHFNAYADRKMVEALARHDLTAMRLREKIALAVRLRLEPWDHDREAVRRGIGLLALPGNGACAARITYRTVDAVWHAVGDTATDFSFYTKRALLAAVYSATVLYWLDDRSETAEDTWSFLDRRLSDVLQIPRLMSRLTKPAEWLPQPFRRLDPAAARRRFGVRGG